MKRRWMFGGYELTHNPKSYSGGMSMSGEVVPTVNGVMTSSNLYYNNQVDFSFNLYEKPTKFGSPLITHQTYQYTSISEDNTTGHLTLLRKGTNLYDVYNTNGAIVYSGGSVNLASGSVASAIARIDLSRIACIYPNGNFVICADNGVQISKYTYSSQEIKDCTSLAWKSGDFVLLLNKFGKIFRVNKTNGETETQFTFGDFDSNSISGNGTYAGIHYTKEGYIGIIKGSRIIYMDSLYNVIHSLDLKHSTMSSISYVFYLGLYLVTIGRDTVSMVPNMSGIELDNVRKQLFTGAISLTDENNIRNLFFIKQVNIRRLNSLGESRYEISISGQIS